MTPLTMTAAQLAAIRADTTLNKTQRDALYKEIDECHAEIEILRRENTALEDQGADLIQTLIARVEVLVAKLEGSTPSVPEEPTPPTPDPEPPPVVVIPSSPAGWRAHEPIGDGWKPQFEVPLHVLPGLGVMSSEGTVTWDPDGLQRLSVIADPTAPLGGNALQTEFPQGMQPGAAPAKFLVGVADGTPGGKHFAPNRGDIYTCFYVKRSAHWYEEGAGTKLFFQRPDGPTRGMNAYISMSRKSDTTSSRLPTCCFPTNETYDCRSSQMEIADGVWHLVESLWTAGDAGVANATAKLWVDGVLHVDAKEIMMWLSGTTPVQQFLLFDPTYGGSGTPVPATQHIWLSGLFVSVR